MSGDCCVVHVTKFIDGAALCTVSSAKRCECER